MSTELKDKLEQAKARLDQNEKDRDTLADVGEEVKVKIAALEKQIAAEAKPKLRHGDYGRIKSKVGDREGVILKDEKGKLDFFDDDRSNLPFAKDVFGREIKVHGNIFDDLKAMQETVTEFEVGGNKVEIDKHGVNITDSEDDEQVSILPEDIAEFILKIRQGEATLKRNK